MKKYIVLIIINILSILFVYNDAFLYKDPVVKVIKVKETFKEEIKNDLGLKEKYYIQLLTVEYLNKEKNSAIIENTYAKSEVATEKYRKGDILILQKDNIILKRDIFIVFLVIILFDLLVLIGNKKGLLSYISAIINVAIFTIGLLLYRKGINLTLIIFIEIILFQIITLLLATGFKKITKAAIISSFISTLIFTIFVSLLYITTKFRGINFKSLAYLTVPYEDIFLPSILVASLGAVMDVSVTITSAMDELIKKDKNIKTEALRRSGKNIGIDIMSTMINVLFFTYLCSALPTFVLAIRNGFTVYNYITSNYTIEILRFLLGSIALVIAIPSSIETTIKIYKGGIK